MQIISILYCLLGFAIPAMSGPAGALLPAIDMFGTQPNSFQTDASERLTAAVIGMPIGQRQTALVQTPVWRTAIERSVPHPGFNFGRRSEQPAVVRAVSQGSLGTAQPPADRKALVADGVGGTIGGSRFPDADQDMATGSPGLAVHAKDVSEAAQDRDIADQDPSGASSQQPPLDLPGGSTYSLNQQRLRYQRALAFSPPGGRPEIAVKLAQNLLALGLGPEATSVLHGAAQDASAAPMMRLIHNLLAVADVESGRQPDFTYLSAGAGQDSKELDFWRAAALAGQGNAVAAARLFSTSLKVLRSYSTPLQELLSPVVAETLVKGRQFAAAQQILDATPKQDGLDLARAELLEASGQRADALAAFQKLTRDRNIRSAGIARTQIVLLRHDMKQLGAKDAAEDLSRNLYAWRGASHEEHTRIALADLLAEAGEWPQAFQEVIDAAALPHSRVQELQDERRNLFSRLVASGVLKKLPPASSVTILRTCNDLIPPGTKGAALLYDLASGLLALDLPALTVPVVKELISRTSPGSDEIMVHLAATLSELETKNVAAAEHQISEAAALNLKSPPINQTSSVLAAAENPITNVPKAGERRMIEGRGNSLTHKPHRQGLSKNAEPDEAESKTRNARQKPVRVPPPGRVQAGSKENSFHPPAMHPLGSGISLSAALNQISHVERNNASTP